MECDPILAHVYGTRIPVIFGIFVIDRNFIPILVALTALAVTRVVV
jgi:hypothetical protein